MSLRKGKRPQLTREQFLAATPHRSEGVRAARDERATVTLWVWFRPPPLIGRLSRLLDARPNERKLELNTVGSFVWEMCDGRTTVAETIRRTEGEAGYSATFLRTMAVRRTAP